MATLTAPAPRAPRAAPTSCPANIQETKIGFGYQPQADLTTANTAAEIWSLTKTNPALGVVTPNTETDADDIGKGDEFPTTQYPSHLDTAVPIEKYASSEFLAHTFCFATGKASMTGDVGTGIVYEAVPSDPVVNCINLPPFTYVEQIRAEPDSVVDRALIGCVVNDFTLAMASGPGRANCKVSANWVGTGRYAAPSMIVIPATIPEHFLNAASATITINGIDYTLGGGFISLEFKYDNAVRLPSGFYPGSGEQNGYAVRGRMEYGKRVISLTFVARASKGSIEFNNLMSLAEGVTTITLKGGQIGTGAGYHGMNISAPRTVLSSVVNGDTDGIVNVNCGVTFLKPPAGDIITMSATTDQLGILGLT
jgi:hypothetical protein